MVYIYIQVYMYIFICIYIYVYIYMYIYYTLFSNKPSLTLDESNYWLITDRCHWCHLLLFNATHIWCWHCSKPLKDDDVQSIFAS